MILVNFKTYPQGTGNLSLKLVEICQKIQKTSGVKIIPVVQTVDLRQATQKFPDLEIWIQHLDWQPAGQWTGWVNLEAAAEAGASGTLLNHSEHPLPPGTVNQVIKRVKDFKVMVCCRTIGQATRLAKFKPDFLAYEPPELIGNKEKSVATEKPKAIKKIASFIKPIPLIVGAGINSREDVKTGLKMGACGILVSSGVVLSEEPEKVLSDFASAFGDSK